MIRLIMAAAQGKWSWNIFSGSELAISLMLLALFLSQSISNREILLENDDKKEEAREEILVWLVLAIVFAVLFALNVAFDFLVLNLGDKKCEGIVHGFKIVTVLTGLFALMRSISAQRSFRLKAKIW